MDNDWIVLGVHRGDGVLLRRAGVAFNPAIDGSGYSWECSCGGCSYPGQRAGACKHLLGVFYTAKRGHISERIEWTPEGQAAAEACGCFLAAREQGKGGEEKPKTGDTASPFGAGNNKKARQERRRQRRLAALAHLAKVQARLEAFEAKHGAALDAIAAKDAERREARAARRAASKSKATASKSKATASKSKATASKSKATASKSKEGKR